MPKPASPQLRTIPGNAVMIGIRDDAPDDDAQGPVAADAKKRALFRGDLKKINTLY